MRTAVDNFQRSVFTILLFLSACSGLISDLAGTGRSGFYFAFDVTIIALSLMSISYINGRLALIIVFILTCIGFNLSYNDMSLLGSLNGLREILNVLCLSIYFNYVFSDENEALAAEYVSMFRTFATIFLIAQLPVAFYQFSKFGPSDMVGGTYGSFGSGNLTLTTCCLVFFMAHFTRNLTQQVLLYVCLVPLLLNETKVSFILIPLLLMFIHFKPRAKSIIGAAVAGGLALFLFNMFFTTNMGGVDFDNNITGIFSRDFIDSYLFGDIYSSTDVPRFTKIIVAWQLLEENINTFLFGFEYGLFRTSDMVDESRFSQSFEWLMVGTRPYLFFLMMQGGMMFVAGILWLIAYINRYFKSHNNKYKTFLFLLFVIILFYNDALRSQNVLIVYFFSIFFANSLYYKREFATEEA